MNKKRTNVKKFERAVTHLNKMYSSKGIQNNKTFKRIYIINQRLKLLRFQSEECRHKKNRKVLFFPKYANMSIN